MPNLIGERLKKAKKQLTAANCRLGNVKGHGTKVKKQHPKAGTVLPTDSKVNVRLG